MKRKYIEIYEALEGEIRSGVHPEGGLLPTELELCGRFDASRPTVAKALEMLRGKGAIDRCAGFGTVVLKSELTRGKPIGLLIPRLGETEIFEPICAAIEKAGADYHLQPIRPPAYAGDAAETAERLCRRYTNEGVAGVFFTPVEHVPGSKKLNLSIVERLREAGIPVVLLDRDVVDWPGQTQHDLIGIDNIQAGFVVASHLLEQGCKSIVFATHPEPAMTVRLRIMGCREALLQNGQDPEALIVQELPDSQPSNAIMQHSPDGLVCANDATAAELMREVIDRGVSVPGELKVAAFDDVKYASLLSVPLTTYHQPCEDIGRAAVDAMILRIEHPEAAPRRLTLQGTLVVRRSTGEETETV